MERRKAVTAAAAISITFFLGAAGLTANATILGARDANGVGTISPVPARGSSDSVRPTTTTAASHPRPASVPVPAAVGDAGSDTGPAAPQSGATDAAPAPQVPAPPAAPSAGPAPTAPAPTAAAAASDEQTDGEHEEIEREHQDPSEHEFIEGSDDDD